MKKIIIYMMAMVAVFAPTSCLKNDIDNLNGQLDELESGRIATVETQMKNAQASITELVQTSGALTALITVLEDEMSELREKESEYTSEMEELSFRISSLQIIERELQDRIVALREFVSEHLEEAGDWTETTFATLAQCDSLYSALAAISVQMDEMEETLEDDAEKAYAECVEVVKDGTEKTRISMQEWINAKFDDYYTIDEMDETVAAAIMRIAPSDSARKEALNAVALAIDSAKVEITQAYESAIEDAIRDAEGALTDTIVTRIDAAKDELSARMDVIQPFIDEIAGRVDAVVAKLLQYIQSMEVVPTYEDGSVNLDKHGVSKITFDVSPASAARNLVDAVTASGKYEIFKFTVKDPAQSAVERTIRVDSASIDEEGHLELFVDCSGLGEDFFSGNSGWLQARLHITSGCTDRMSEYFSFHVYPATPSDIENELDKLYVLLQKMAMDPLHAPWFIDNLLSDECNGGGTVDHFEGLAISHLMTTDPDFFLDTWNYIYEGIAVSNFILADSSKLDWGSREPNKKQMLGEAYFMRGLFTFWGSQLWGDIPAYWQETEPEICPQLSAKDTIYPHILADFASAYELCNNVKTERYHIGKGAAAGMLARAYLFYHGFYNCIAEVASGAVPDIKMPPGTAAPEYLTKQYVINILNGVIASGYYGLVSDFRQLWPYSSESVAPCLDLMADLVAGGDFWWGNRNSEEVFYISFEPGASPFSSDSYSNLTPFYCSLCPGNDEAGFYNGGTGTLPFAQGMGMGTINANLVNEWPTDDSRHGQTVLDIMLSGPEPEKYYFLTSCLEDGIYNRKWMEYTCKKSSFYDFGKSYTWWGVERAEGNKNLPDLGNSLVYDHFVDVMLIRYADILLMHTELTGDAQWMNKVRERAGLNDIAYSIKNIETERHYELAAEGVRFNDLRRWSGNVRSFNCKAAKELDKQNKSRIIHRGEWSVIRHASSWASRYEQTGGFLQIPESVIKKVGNPDVLKQNSGWEASESSNWLMTEAPRY